MVLKWYISQVKKAVVVVLVIFFAGMQVGCDGGMWMRESIDKRMERYLNTSMGVEKLSEEIENSPMNKELHLERLALLLAMEDLNTAQGIANCYVYMVENCGHDPILLEGLRSDNYLVRANAATAIGYLKWQAAGKALRRSADDRHPEVRKASVRALGKLANPDFQFVLLLSLKDGDWEVRAEAAKALGMLKDPSVTKYLFPVLDDIDEFVRYEALRALIDVRSADKASLYRQEWKEKESVRRANTGVTLLAMVGKLENWQPLEEVIQSQHQELSLEAAKVYFTHQPEASRKFFQKILADGEVEEDSDLAGFIRKNQ